MNPLLYGYNADERIVAVHPADDRTMRIYFRGDDRFTVEDAPFYPFFFLSDRELVAGYSQNHWLKELAGDGYYRFVCVVESWTALWHALRHVLDNLNRTARAKRVESVNDLEEVFLYPDPVTQYLIQSGRTLFKGMAFSDLRRMQLDIETYSSGHRGISDPSRDQDRIILIALSDSTGWSHLVNGREMDEPKMLQSLVEIVQERDPDIIEGHNILGFDLPFISRRADLHGLQLRLGREGTTIRHNTNMIRPYEQYSIPGRNILDTLHLVQSYDTSKRDMESYGLKYAAKYFGVASPERTYVRGDRISWHWDHDPEPLLRYAMDDVAETGHISSLLAGSTFYATQMVPTSLATASRSGSAAKIESLFVREYLRQRHSLPKPSQGFQTAGGYTDIFITGLLAPILHADVESLYPSIMLSRNIRPAADFLGVFPRLLKELTSMRLAAKRSMVNTHDQSERSRIDALQSSFKILINSFYGYLGYGRGLFNDYEKADAVTAAGRDILRTMIANLEVQRSMVVEVDTDGVFFVPPESVQTVDDEQALLTSLGGSLPEGISIALGGRYRRMLSYKMKNYALEGYDRRFTIKGSSLISRSMEKFGRDFVRRCIEMIMDEDFTGLHSLYCEMRERIATHQWDVKDFARVETLKDSVDQYQRDVASGRRHKHAPYEIAISSGRGQRRGTRIAYYVTGSEANVKEFENCRPSEEWNPTFPDENVAYYLKRLDEIAEKFRVFFLPQHFHDIFSPDDLFPFDPTGITIIRRTLPRGTPPEPENVE